MIKASILKGKKAVSLIHTEKDDSAHEVKYTRLAACRVDTSHLSPGESIMKIVANMLSSIWRDRRFFPPQKDSLAELEMYNWPCLLLHSGAASSPGGMCCHPNEISLFSVAEAFVPSGWEAIKLSGSAGSPAQHNTCGTNTKQKQNEREKKRVWPPPKSLPRRLWRSQPQRAAGRVTAEQISSNLSALVQRLQWEGYSPVPPLPSPSNLHHRRHHLLLPVPALRPPCQRDTSGGGWSCRMVCGAQQAAALPRRKSLSEEELARDWSAPPVCLRSQ